MSEEGFEGQLNIGVEHYVGIVRIQGIIVSDLWVGLSLLDNR